MPKMVDHLASIAEIIKNISVTSGVLLAGIYLMWPDYRIWVREKIYGESAWFYLGWWRTAPPGYCKDGQEGCTRNFYFVTGFDPATGDFQRGTVLMNTKVAQGSEQPGLGGDYSSGLATHKVKALTVLTPNKCIYILETKPMPILEDLRLIRNGHLKAEYRKGIWARAIPGVCQSPAG